MDRAEMITTVGEDRLAELETAVAAGAAWLDTELPGWRDRINPDTLDMAEPELCILGQAVPPSDLGKPDWWRNMDWRGVAGYTRARYIWPDMNSQERGFLGEGNADDQVLKTLWLAVVAAVPSP